MRLFMGIVKPLFFALSMILSVMPMMSQSREIVEVISRDSIITIVQPGALHKRLTNFGGSAVTEHVASNEHSKTDDAADEENSVGNSGAATQRVAGYRVQVFSDNNARTAKNEARSKAKAINEAIPHYRTYVIFDAPYWRLKVGDFRLRGDAEEAADEIKKLFPSYSREVRVVRDRINVKM